jgi:hypothetical protein
MSTHFILIHLLNIYKTTEIQFIKYFICYWDLRGRQTFKRLISSIEVLILKFTLKVSFTQSMIFTSEVLEASN